MPKRISKKKATKKKPKRSKDVNTNVFQMQQEHIQRNEDNEPPEPTQEEISRIMSHLGKKGGKIGGKRRLVTMTPEQRREIATKAAKARWEKEKRDQ